MDEYVMSRMLIGMDDAQPLFAPGTLYRITADGTTVNVIVGSDRPKSMVHANLFHHSLLPMLQNLRAAAGLLG